MTKEKAFEALTFEDHGILPADEAREIAKAFRFLNVRTFTFKDERSQFKGAYFSHLKEGDRFEGIGTMELAHAIAKHLGVDTNVRSYHGRGTQARAYFEAIKATL